MKGEHPLAEQGLTSVGRILLDMALSIDFPLVELYVDSLVAT